MREIREHEKMMRRHKVELRKKGLARTKSEMEAVSDDLSSKAPSAKPHPAKAPQVTVQN